MLCDNTESGNWNKSTFEAIPNFLLNLMNLYLNFDNIQTVAKSKIGDLITYLSSVRLDEANTAISFALGLDELIY